MNAKNSGIIVDLFNFHIRKILFLLERDIFLQKKTDIKF